MIQDGIFLNCVKCAQGRVSCAEISRVVWCRRSNPFIFWVKFTCQYPTEPKVSHKHFCHLKQTECRYVLVIL